PSRSALRRATSIASAERSTPITCPAPSRSATNESTPEPQPTSTTMSPGWISSASAIVRLVCVGANTASSSSIVNGPVRPFHSNGCAISAVMRPPWWTLSRGSVNRPNDRRFEPCVLARHDVTTLDGVRERIRLLGHPRRLDPPVAGRVSADAARGPAEQLHGAVRVAPEQVDEPGAELREPFVELRVVGL